MLYVASENLSFRFQTVSFRVDNKNPFGTEGVNAIFALCFKVNEQ